MEYNRCLEEGVELVVLDVDGEAPPVGVLQPAAAQRKQDSKTAKTRQQNRENKTAKQRKQNTNVIHRRCV